MKMLQRILLLKRKFLYNFHTHQLTTVTIDNIKYNNVLFSYYSACISLTSFYQS